MTNADATIQELEQTIERLVHELKNERRQRLELGDYARPEDVAEALEERTLRSWPRSRRQALADLIVRRS
jgi:hypothetical protein